MEPRLIDLNDYILTGGGFMGESWFIDVGEFGYGYPLVDLGIFMSVANYTSEEMMQKLYHMGRDSADRPPKYLC